MITLKCNLIFIKLILQFFSLLEKKFSSAKEVCETIQNFILVSKYNLKRINSNRKDLITFCCSCASRKVPLIKKKNRKKSDSNLASMKFSDNDIFYNNNENEINVFNFVKKRKIKRLNVDACTFRIKFKFNFEGNYFSFKTTKNLIHNHIPNFTNDYKVIYIFPVFFNIYFYPFFLFLHFFFYILLYNILECFDFL